MQDMQVAMSRVQGPPEKADSYFLGKEGIYQLCGGRTVLISKGLDDLPEHQDEDEPEDDEQGE